MLVPNNRLAHDAVIIEDTAVKSLVIVVDDELWPPKIFLELLDGLISTSKVIAFLG